jgi:hypothetical protein
MPTGAPARSAAARSRSASMVVRRSSTRWTAGRNGLRVGARSGAPARSSLLRCRPCDGAGRARPHRPPVTDDGLDAGPVRFLTAVAHRRQRRGGGGDGLADGDTDLARAKVETQAASARRWFRCCPFWVGLAGVSGLRPGGQFLALAQAWPASPLSRFRSTPSNCAAASQRSAGDILNMMSPSAGPLSQALALSSSSNWPLPQPA